MATTSIKVLQQASAPWPARPARRGRAAFALGRPSRAARYLERSIVAAESLGARYDLARALLGVSRVIPGRADEFRRRGHRLLDELGAVIPEAERSFPSSNA